MPLSQHATANTLGYNLDKPASHVSEELSWLHLGKTE